LLIIPRTAGVSSSSTLWRIRRSPRPRTVARWDSLVPITLFTNVTLTVFSGLGLLALAAFREAAVFRGAAFAAGVFFAPVAFFAAVFFGAALAAVFFAAVFFAAVFFVSAMLITPEFLRRSCRA